MGSRKRGRQQLAQEEGMISIKLAAVGTTVDNSGPLTAKGLILRSCSTCAEGLPVDADTWDLSQLQIEGAAVEHEVVVAWLNCAYGRILNSSFQKQDEDLRRTVSGLTELLAFADAVGSNGGILAECISELPRLQLEMQLSGEPVRLKLDGQGYYFEDPAELSDNEDEEGNEDKKLRLSEITPEEDYYVAGVYVGDLKGCNSAEASAFGHAVAEQVEPLLYQAYKLQLQPVIDCMHTFIAGCTHHHRGVLRGVLTAVFTDRVLELVLPVNASQAAKDAWINSVVTVPCGFTSHCSIKNLLQYTSEDTSPIEFSAKLRKNFMGSAAGTAVDVTLDLFKSSEITIGALKCPVQLLLGPAIVSKSDRRSLMGPARVD